MEDPLSAPYVIRPFTEADVALAHRWRRRPHVQKWWGDPAGEPEEEKLSDGRIAMWIAEDRSGPLGFIQDYRVHGWEDHPFAYLPEGSRGIDLYLGDDAVRGRGYGARLLRQHAAALLASGVPALGIDPHPENVRAVRAFEKAGFRQTSGPTDTRWGRAVLMECGPVLGG